MSAIVVNTPVEFNEPIVVAPYLNTSLPPDSTIEKLVVAKVAALPPILSPAAVPVMFVPTSAEGVPKAGVTRVGLVDSTLLPEPVEVVTPVPPDVTANAVLSVGAVLNVFTPVIV
jgi:hypothetical protein